VAYTDGKYIDFKNAPLALENVIQLYHLGLGAGGDPMDKRDLRYLTDGTPQVLPTFGNVAQSFHMTEPPSVQVPGGRSGPGRRRTRRGPECRG
jgi:hypothetical protein